MCVQSAKTQNKLYATLVLLVKFTYIYFVFFLVFLFCFFFSFFLFLILIHKGMLKKRQLTLKYLFNYVYTTQHMMMIIHTTNYCYVSIHVSGCLYVNGKNEKKKSKKVADKQTLFSYKVLHKSLSQRWSSQCFVKLKLLLRQSFCV